MADNMVKLFQSSVEFESFGKSVIAYVRPMRSDQLNQQFPEGPELPSGVDVWALFGADGQPIAVSDERSELIDNAEDMDLLTVGLQ